MDILDNAQKQINNATSQMNPASPSAGMPPEPPPPAPTLLKEEAILPKTEDVVPAPFIPTAPIPSPVPPESPPPPSAVNTTTYGTPNTPPPPEAPINQPPKKGGIGKGVLLAGLLLVLVTLPVAIYYISQQQQQLTENRSRASEPPANVQWCTTWTCPNGDTNGDGQCRDSDTGASFTTGSGTSCTSSGCGQVDYYCSGTPGVPTDADYCGGYVDFSNCGGGGGGGGAPAGKCQQIRIFNKDRKVVLPSTLKPGDRVTIAVEKQGEADKGRIRINGGPWTVTEEKVSENFIFPWTVPTGIASFTIEAEVHVDGAWK